MRLYLIASACFLAACRPNPGVDGGSLDAGQGDGGQSDAAISDAGLLDAGPEEPPDGPGCENVIADGGWSCISAGEFTMSRWSAYVHIESGHVQTPSRPQQLVYLPAFLLSRTEVTNNQYAAFLRSVPGSRHPDYCGYEDADINEEWPVELPYIQESSGWIDGGFDEATDGERPVVCVTRSEAMAYCAAQGGRLPTVAEYMKAARAPAPDVRRFPWGDEPTPLDAGQPDLSQLPPGYAGVRLRRNNTLSTVPVRSSVYGRGYWRVYELVGNVSEWTLECKEQLAEAYGDGGSTVSPQTPTALDDCNDAALVVGSNWASNVPYPFLLSETLYSVTDAQYGIIYVESTPGTGWLWELDSLGIGVFGKSRPMNGAPDAGAGNTRRSWRIGFRCARDLP